MGGSYVDVSSEFENKDDLSMPCEQSSGQILPEQMSPLQLNSVQDGPRNPSLKFGQNQVSIS